MPQIVVNYQDSLLPSIQLQDHSFINTGVVANCCRGISSTKVLTDATWQQCGLLPVVGPILWGHSGPVCHALSLSWTSMHRRRATVATPGEWKYKIRACGGSQWRMGPTFFQMLLVIIVNCSFYISLCCYYS